MPIGYFLNKRLRFCVPLKDPIRPLKADSDDFKGKKSLMKFNALKIQMGMSQTLYLYILFILAPNKPLTLKKITLKRKHMNPLSEEEMENEINTLLHEMEELVFQKEVIDVILTSQGDVEHSGLNESLILIRESRLKDRANKFYFRLEKKKAS